MAECGCLPPEQRDEVIEILDMFAYTLDDDERAKRIEKTRDDIRECKCPTSSSDDSKKKKKKREPSEYNKQKKHLMNNIVIIYLILWFIWGYTSIS
jgi:Mg2+/citrate symporter